MTNDGTTLDDKQIDAIVDQLRSALAELGIDAEHHQADGVRGLTARARRPGGSDVRLVLSITSGHPGATAEVSGVARQRIRRDDGVTLPTLGTPPATGQRSAGGMPAGAARDDGPDRPAAT